jgi:hypothetical protein
MYPGLHDFIHFIFVEPAFYIAYTNHMSDDDIHVIIEHFDSKIDALLENIDAKIDQKLKPLSEKIVRIKQDLAIIKKVVTATNHDVADHEIRIQKLETAAF